jgi:hypothetical protein
VASPVVETIEAVAGVTSGELLRETGSIYALTTPQGTPFYVGATMQRPRERVMYHLRLARRGARRSEVYELLAEVGRTGFWVLESGVEPERLGEREAHHIAELRDAGYPMLNHRPGGYGCQRQLASRRGRLSAMAKKRPRDGGGRFAPALPAIAGAAPSAGEAFMGGGEL